MTWTPPAGASEQSKAEFWSPKKEGETVIGVCVRFDESYHGPYVELAPVIHYPVGSDPQRYAHLLVGLNSWLDKVIHPGDHKGKALALTYQGKEQTPKGNMFTYKVYELTLEEWNVERVRVPERPGGNDEPPPSDEPPF